MLLFQDLQFGIIWLTSMMINLYVDQLGFPDAFLVPLKEIPESFFFFFKENPYANLACPVANHTKQTRLCWMERKTIRCSFLTLLIIPSAVLGRSFKINMWLK